MGLLVLKALTRYPKEARETCPAPEGKRGAAKAGDRRIQGKYDVD